MKLLCNSFFKTALAKKITSARRLQIYPQSLSFGICLRFDVAFHEIDSTEIIVYRRFKTVTATANNIKCCFVKQVLT